MTNAPHAIGIIMDGNRRYARERGLPTLEGHRKGLEKIKEAARWAFDAGIHEVTFYTFSTENWKRAEEEVSYLMNLFEFAFGEWLEELIAEGIRIRFIGERERAPEKVERVIAKTEEKTKDHTKGTLVFAFSYGGRAEIINAVNKLLAEGKESASEEELRAHMWSADLVDPDLIIRTSGEERLSNFLTWQSVYSELFFTKTYWPALEKEEFDSILAAYEERERRHGK